VKALYNILDTFLAAIWSLTIVDILLFVDLNKYDVDSFIKTLLAIAGLIYLVGIKIPHEYKNNKLNRQIRKEELEKLEMENDDYKKNHSDSDNS
tara:strand:+ start:625 stop:906 length:282 start_codon:yes stop_codon:yes gene_type:complete